MREKKKGESPLAPTKTPYAIRSLNRMITDDGPGRTELVMLFRMDIPEEAEALHTFRAAFAGATDIEAVTPELFALHIRPGVCVCGEGPS